MKYGNRIRLSLWIGLGLFLVAASFALLLYSSVPETPASRGPLLLASFIAILIGSLLCILVLFRWLLNPYSKLVGEAERVAIEPNIRQSKDEAEFVLETFQSVLAQLDAQRIELKRLSEQARERADSAERFSERIVASVPSGLVAFDSSGKTTVINAPGRTILEVDQLGIGPALGQPAESLLKNVPRLTEMVHECLKTGKSFRREEIESTTSNGSPRRLGAAIAPIELSPERGDRGVLCLLTDITEVTQLREQLTLKQNLASLGEMSAGLAHEFKNTIATLHGYVQLLQNVELSEQGRQATSSLLNEVRALADMVTSFLNFARPQPLNLETVSLGEMVDDCATELAPLLKERRVELKVEPSVKDGAPSVPADERMLRQSFINLIRNAVEAIPDDKQPRRVTIHMTSNQDHGGEAWAVIKIEDTGGGIPEKDLQRIFIPFFTTKASGHGVGLALAHRVITEHGGTLEAANAPEGGAVFTIKLPMKLAAD